VSQRWLEMGSGSVLPKRFHNGCAVAKRSDKPALEADSRGMELAGLEPATSWVRYGVPAV
jgi:hypothetical protein